MGIRQSREGLKPLNRAHKSKGAPLESSAASECDFNQSRGERKACA